MSMSTSTTKAKSTKSAKATKSTKQPKGAKSEKKEPKPRKPTKSDLLEEAADLLARIEAAEVECQSARLELDDARETVKLKKQSYGACVDNLRKLARARREKHPLFDTYYFLIDVHFCPTCVPAVPLH